MNFLEIIDINSQVNIYIYRERETEINTHVLNKPCNILATLGKITNSIAAI